MIHIKKIKPLFTSIVTTGDKFEKDMIEGGIIIARKGDLKLWQKVIAVGSTVRDIKEGDMVMINAENYMVKKYDKNSLQNDMDNNPSLGYRFNWVTIDDEKGDPQDCLLLNDRDVLYVFEGEEKDNMLITPGKSNLIV
jgi:co-chaperonin GroES (HSP10)